MVLRTYPRSRSQLGNVDQVGNGEREKRRERPKKRWLDEVTEKNRTQTIDGISNLVTNSREWRKAVHEVTIKSR